MGLSSPMLVQDHSMFCRTKITLPQVWITSVLWEQISRLTASLKRKLGSLSVSYDKALESIVMLLTLPRSNQYLTRSIFFPWLGLVFHSSPNFPSLSCE